MRLHRYNARPPMSNYLLFFLALCAALGTTVLWVLFQLFIMWVTLD